MVNYCYVTRFAFLTSSELNFITRIKKSQNIDILILNNNIVVNLIYRCLLQIILTSEFYLQKYFKVSRYYLSESLIRIDSDLLVDKSSNEIIYRYIYLGKNGIEISEDKDFLLKKGNVVQLFSKFGSYKNNNYQNLITITKRTLDISEELFNGLYEKDKLALNNKVISMRRVFHHFLLIL